MICTTAGISVRAAVMENYSTALWCNLGELNCSLENKMPRLKINCNKMDNFFFKSPICLGHGYLIKLGKLLV